MALRAACGGVQVRGCRREGGAKEFDCLTVLAGETTTYIIKVEYDPSELCYPTHLVAISHPNEYIQSATHAPRPSMAILTCLLLC